MTEPESPPVVAEGVSGSGHHWQVLAEGDSDDYTTWLVLDMPDGTRVHAGGHGGPVLLPGRMMSVSIHRSDPGLHYIVGRVDPHICSLRVILSGSRPAVVATPAGRSDEHGVLFVAAILPESAEVHDVVGLDSDGEPMETLDATRYSTALNYEGPCH